MDAVAGAFVLLRGLEKGEERVACGEFNCEAWRVEEDLWSVHGFGHEVFVIQRHVMCIASLSWHVQSQHASNP